MSEKRFSVDDDGIYDNQEKKHFKFTAYDWMECDIYECCDLLNEQRDIIKSKDSLLSILAKENEQLREELNNLKKDETMLYHYYTLARYGGDGV